MRPLLVLCLLLFPLTGSQAAHEPQKVSFPSLDGIEVTADVFVTHEKTAPFLVLFQRAQWSRGEYREIAPRLNALGFNCMAVDLRSGGPVENIDNETAARAKAAGKGTSYVDTVPDIETAVTYARKHYAQGKLAVWGSSYSASLVVKLLGDDPGFADAALSFTPGEYFTKFGMPADWITRSASKLQKPVFITSAANEKDRWHGIYAAIPSADKHFFLPASGGQHGSRALWERYPDNPGYWKATEQFLNRYLK